ncbi:MAG: oxidoreductase, partial [Acidimicrobiales bacterium]|nr:oxidoreductase [Acidimicrobiales bacterium]
GIDLAGVVTESRHPEFSPGQGVVLDGWHVGESHWGGYATKARVRGDWLVPIPDPFSPWDAMALGTAGFTAMLAAMALEDHGLAPGRREVLVTGAAGGVGSVAVIILSALGYQVAASTGRPSEADYLRSLGAASVVDRAELSETSNRPLESERWAACVDAVGGTTLARVLAQTAYGGAVAAVGLAGGNELHTTVIPFLLRGVSLLGIDSVMCPAPRRRVAWQRLAEVVPKAALETIASDARLEDLPSLAPRILAGQVRGRLVVDLSS